MLAVARELGASETAFVLPSDRADRRLRYFTPEAEVELCGHATVAAHALLRADGRVEPGTSTVETDAGVLEVTVEPDGLVWMGGTGSEVRAIEGLEYPELAEALGVDPAALADIGADLPLARADAGLSFLVVPVNFLEHVGKMAPDAAAVTRLSERFDVAGVYAFTFDTLEPESTLHARMFAPALGIPEDPVTGTAAAAAGAYLERFGAVDTDRMRFEQGEFLDRGGRVGVAVDADGVRIGGRAVTALDGELTVPPGGDDDILEA
jgi:PhzF family phenazine biosynthesis protein